MKRANRIDPYDPHAIEAKWKARVTIRLQIRKPGSRVEREYQIREESTIQPRNATGMVQGINEALDRAMPRLMDHIADFLRSQ